jgi:hypothetical protein
VPVAGGSGAADQDVGVKSIHLQNRTKMSCCGR